LITQNKKAQLNSTKYFITSGRELFVAQMSSRQAQSLHLIFQ